MSGPPHTADDRRGSPAHPTGGAGTPLGDPRSGTPRRPCLTVVKYEDRPNRGTIHPHDLTGIERMETWLSADASAFVDLSAWR